MRRPAPRKPSVLVVERLEFLANLAAQSLADAGCRVSIARSKREALQRLKRARPAVLVVDASTLTLEEMASLGKQSGAPSIVLGGFSPDEGSTPEEVLAATGAACYLMKPFRGSELAETVTALLTGDDSALARLRAPPAPAASPSDLAELPLERLARRPFREFADVYLGRIARKLAREPEGVSDSERDFVDIEAVLHYGVPHWFELEYSDSAPETVRALRRANLEAEASALESAMARLGTPWPEELEARKALVTRLGRESKDVWSAESSILRFRAANEAKIVAYLLSSETRTRPARRK